MALKSYIDLSGLGHFKDKLLVEDIGTSDGTPITSTTYAPSVKGMADYIDNVVTTQVGPLVDAKISKSTLTAAGDIITATGASTPSRLGIGSAGQVLTVDSGAPSWKSPDSAPASGSSNTITSGAVYTGLAGKADNAVFSTTANGLVPKASGEGATAKFLRGDGQWAEASAGGDAYSLDAGANGVAILKKNGTAQDTVTVYTHPSGTAKVSGLYKVSVNATGHVSGATAVVKGDITALGIPAQDTTYEDATTSAHGLMSTTDKVKLDGVEDNANNYVHPSSFPAKTTEAVYKMTVDTNGHVTAGDAVEIPSIAGLVPETRKVAGNALSSDISAATLKTSLGLKSAAYTESSAYATAAQGGKADTALQASNIIDTVASTSTTDALSANMGKTLNDRIDSLASRGRFLSVWNSTTGKPTTDPTDLPYTYKAGDYYIVGTTGTTNYRPDGDSYTGAASTTVESASVASGDTYLYDSSSWVLQHNTGTSVTFQQVGGDPMDNTNLAAALNAKAGTAVFSTSANGLVPKAGGTGDTSKFLKGDGTWSAVSQSSYSLEAGTNGQVILKKDGTAQDTVTAYTHPGSGTNPHGTTKADIGLGSVPNTDFTASVAAATAHIADADIHVTDAQKTAWSGKQDAITASNKLAASLVSGLATVATSGSYNDLSNKPTIPAEVTESTVAGWGFTKNAGTITGITMNGASKGTSGVVNLGTVITAHQDISGKADKATTLAGYGITDAKIESGVITLGTSTITPITSHQDISGKIDKSVLTTTGDIIYASAAGTPARLGAVPGKVLATDSSTGLPSYQQITETYLSGGLIIKINQGASAVQTVKVNGTEITKENLTVDIPADTTVTSGSANLVTSGAVYTGLSGKAATSHAHGNITSDGKIGSTSGDLVVTGANGLITTNDREPEDNDTGPIMFYVSGKGYKATPNSSITSYSDGDSLTIGGSTGDIYVTLEQGNITATGGISAESATFTGTVIANEFRASSSRAVKENITPFEQDATSLINNIDVVSFNYKSDKEKNFKVGFIAEDTDEIFATKKHNCMDVASTVGVLLKAIQELNRRIEVLEKKLAEKQN